MPFNEDFTEQLNELLAPYRRQAESMNSPYTVIGQGGWLARQHPKIAQYLDNAFLAAAMTPSPQGPEGAGEGISRAFQGLLGAQQFKRQRAMEQAMLPHQMLAPQLSAAEKLAEIKAQSAHTGLYEAQASRLLHPGPQIDTSEMTDIAGIPWTKITDRTTGETKLLPVMPPDAKPLPEGYQPRFRDRTQTQFGGLSEAERYVSGASLDAVNQARTAQGLPPMRLNEFQSSMLGFVQGRAGAGAAGTTGVTTPLQERKTFLAVQREQAEGLLERTLSPSEFRELHAFDPNYYTAEGPDTLYKQHIEKGIMERDRLNFHFNQYEKSGAWKKGISFQEWITGHDIPRAKSATPTLPVTTPPIGGFAAWKARKQQQR